MIESSHSHANEPRRGCRKREESIGDEEGPPPPEIKSHPFKYGYVSILGRKRSMEDPMTVMPPQKLTGGYSFFAAYGGRGRAKVAETCTERLHQCLAKLPPAEEGLGWGKVVKDCFSCMYEKWSGQAAAEMVKFTAVVVAGEKGEVAVVNWGGSRAVLWSSGVALPLWSDHNKLDQAQGGTRNDELVSTSRSQGKRSSEPEVTMMRRNDESEDFLIIASDGLWKVVGKEMACEVARKCLGGEIRRLALEGEDGASQATTILAELAIAKGSEDNITIIVVDLNST